MFFLCNDDDYCKVWRDEEMNVKLGERIVNEVERCAAKV